MFNGVNVIFFLYFNKQSKEHMYNTFNSKKKQQTSKNFTQLSFRTTYVFMVLACILAFSASFFVKTPNMRKILWVETIICGFASYIYAQYNDSIDTYNLSHTRTLGWAGVNKLRYIDWAVTTPLMLISLTLFLSHHSNVKVDPSLYFGIVILDWLMLYFGYAGETNKMTKMMADIFGFIPLIVIFGLLYRTFIHGRNNKENNIIISVYFVIWSLYGVLYMFDEKVMNTWFNILDCIAKAFVSMAITAYFLKRNLL